MNKNIYTMLNHVETDLSVYEIKELEQGVLEEKTARILGRLHTEKRRSSMKRILQAAAVLTAALLSAGGVAYAATDGELFQYIYTFISGGGIYETKEYTGFGEESTVTVVMGGAETADENGTAQAGVPLVLQDGRLYFTGDGSKTDITDNISEEEPYYIDVTDEAGNTHRFIIGGRAEAGCYGYNEILIDSEGNVRGGVGNFGAKVEESAEWLQKAEEEVLNLYKR